MGKSEQTGHSGSGTVTTNHRLACDMIGHAHLAEVCSDCKRSVCLNYNLPRADI